MDIGSGSLFFIKAYKNFDLNLLEKNFDIDLIMMVEMLDKVEKSFRMMKKASEQHKMNLDSFYRSLFYKVN